MHRTLRLGSLAIAATLLATPAVAADTFAFDKAHTDVVFKVSHFGFSNTVGRFNDADGMIVLDEANPANSSVKVTIQTASVDTNHEKRDEHLRGADFFNAAAHPTMTYESTSVEVTGPSTAVVQGNLTMLGVTKPVQLDMTLNGLKPHPLPQYNGVVVAGFSGTAMLKRSDFGMSTYAPAIGDEIEILLEIEAFKQ